MKRWVASMLSLLLLFRPFSLYPWSAAAIQSTSKALVFTVSKDVDIAYDRILYHAFKQMGYGFSVEATGMTTALMAANSGEADGIINQEDGLSVTYPGLLQVPVSTGVISFEAFALQGSDINLTSWRETAGLRVGILYQKTFIEKALPQDAIVIHQHTVDGLMEALQSGQCDVIVTSSTQAISDYLPSAFKSAGIIATMPVYPYINARHAALLPMLTQILEKMQRDGAFEAIPNYRYSDQNTVKNVLHVSSYYPDMLWEQQLDEGIHSVLDNADSVNILTVHANANRLRSEENRENLITSTLRNSCQATVPDLIIASDNEAFSLVQQYYKVLFPGAPVIFCGINNYTPEMTYSFQNKATGVAESIYAKDTVQYMLKAYPATKNIFVINDNTQSGRIWAQEIKGQLGGFESQGVTFSYNDNMPWDALCQKLATLPEDTLVLTGYYFVDETGLYSFVKQSQTLFADICPRPIFGLMDTTCGFGQLGGKYASAFAQGQRAAELALSVLNGEDIAALPVTLDTQADSSWVFDYTAMERWGVQESMLPDGARLIHNPLPFSQTNPTQFAMIIMFMAFANVIIAILLVFVYNVKKRNLQLIQTQKSLHTAQELLDVIQKAEASLQNIITTAPTPMFIGNPNTHIMLFANNALLKMLEMDSSYETRDIDILAISAETQAGGVPAGVFADEQLRHMSFSESVTFEWILKSQTGKLIETVFIGNMTEYKGEPCLFGIFNDVTAEKQREAMLTNAAQQEKEANELKGRFLMNMSHEIRTPMNAVIGLTTLAMRREQTEENYELLKKIQLSANNLLTIINDILDFSKIDKDKMDLVEDEFDLEDIIANAFMVASERVGSKRIEMLMDIAPDVPYYLYGDKTRVWQVLKNLLDNSAKYTGEGHIILTVRKEPPPEGDPRQWLCFTVDDTGYGMSEENLSKLFSPFSQFHNNFKHTGKGTGLGMTITKKLVELMGGSIEVWSELGKGTRFQVRIPFGKTRNTTTMSDCIRGISVSANRVLIVDDDEYAVLIMQLLLREMGIETEAARNSEQALELVRVSQEEGRPFAIIILDYLIGEENGIELARKMRHIIVDRTKLLMVSAYSKLLPGSEIQEEGVRDVIEKPFVPSAFIQRLSNTMAGKANRIEDELKKFYGARVLVAEDNEINQEVAAGMLGEFGIVPDVASNGQEAIQLLDKQQYDLVLMDIVMPVMDGHEAAVAIRQCGKPYHDIPIIAMSAHVMQGEIDRCHAEGMNGHIGKPIDFAELQKNLLPFLPQSGKPAAEAATPVQKTNEIPGVDFQDGLKRLNGNKALYDKMLQKFATGLETQVFPPLDSLVSHEDREAFGRDIHTLKGSSGNLSARAIYEAAVAFETTLREGAPDQSQYQALIDCCEMTQKGIQAFYAQ